MEVGILILLYVVGCIALGIYLAKVVKPKRDSRRLEQQVELELRQEKAYMAARRKAANKLLREAGEEP